MMEQMVFNTNSQFKACLLGGAIGDAWGSAYENQNIAAKDDSNIFRFNYPPKEASKPTWKLTDDTQLTLATCEAILETDGYLPQRVADAMSRWYRQKRLMGLGSSTLKALQELNVGGHWSQVGRKGEYAAGNGAAIRIAPFAFLPEISINRTLLHEICYITHQNEEAYCGALAVFYAIRFFLRKEKCAIYEYLIANLPDSQVRDRLIEIQDSKPDIAEFAAKYGSSGYVVESVPLAILAAQKSIKIGFSAMMEQVIAVGGDTDSNASMAGQIAGVALGIEGIASTLINQLETFKEYQTILDLAKKIDNLK